MSQLEVGLARRLFSTHKDRLAVDKHALGFGVVRGRDPGPVVAPFVEICQAQLKDPRG